VKTLVARMALGSVIAFVVFMAQTATPTVTRATMISSQNVALVPGPCGSSSGAGCMPTTGFSGGYSPTFTNVATANLPSVINNYDTVVLLQVCNIGTWLADQNWRDALHNWINAGHKLIIYDSDACGGMTLDYSEFIYPFTTNNPGQWGSNDGILEDVEENTLSSTDPSSPYYIDILDIQNNTDAVGDASVMLTQDSNWMGDLRATNVYGYVGYTHTYAEYGSGLIIYNGLDSDYIGSHANLAKLWELELKQQWDPSGLPGGVPVSKVACKAPYDYFSYSSSHMANPWNILAAIAQGFADAIVQEAATQTGLIELQTFLMGGKQGSINMIVDDPATKSPSQFLKTKTELGCSFTPSFTGDAKIVAKFKFKPGSKAVVAAGSAAILPDVEDFLKPALEHYYTQATGKTLDQALKKYVQFADLFKNLITVGVNLQRAYLVDKLYVESYSDAGQTVRNEKTVAELVAVFWSGPYSQSSDLSGQEFTVSLTKSVTAGEEEYISAGLDANLKAWGWGFGVENYKNGLELVNITVSPK